jgi:hypothetical protein
VNHSPWGIGAALPGPVSSQIEAKKAQAAEVQVELVKAKANHLTRGDSKSRRYV